MDLEPTEEMRGARSAIRALLSGTCPPAVVRAFVENGEPPTALLDRLAQDGWSDLDPAEDLLVASVVAEELGRAVAPVGWLSELAARAFTGSEVAACALAVSEGGTAFLPRRFSTVMGEDRLAGEKTAVLDCDGSQPVVVVGGDSQGTHAWVVAPEHYRAVPLQPADRTRSLATVTVDAPRSACMPCPTPVEEAAAAAITLHAWETVGVCRRLLDDTVEYAGLRHQFDRPIGSFQALQHTLADAHLLLERARGAATVAVLAIHERSRDASLTAAAAAVAAKDAAKRVARDALQSHGGIGYTWEHDVHFAVKRARANAVLWGSAEWHRQQVADHLGLPTTAGAAAAMSSQASRRTSP